MLHQGLFALLLALPLLVVHSLPAPLPLICTPKVIHGCYNDSFSRTFPVMVSNGGPDDPFGANATLETCAYLCATNSPPYPAAAIENGGQCFCTDPAGIAKAAPNLTSPSECSTPCNGNGLTQCGGKWKVFAYDFSCTPYVPSPSMPWLNVSLPLLDRVNDLVSRMDPLSMVGQLLQNGVDIYTPTLQLPRYIVSQECLAGYDGGDIYIAPPVPHTASSGFPQPCNMGNTFDVVLVREIANAISDEARAAFIHVGRPSLVCMSPNLNLGRDPRWGRNIESFSDDPALLASLGTAYIAGIQIGLPANATAAASGYLKIAAVAKHLGAYSVECYSADGPSAYPDCPTYRNTFNAVVDTMDLRESYFPAWEAAVKEVKVQGVMCSYNSINGVPSCSNGDVLRTTLEAEWGLEGYVISDADAVAYIGTKGDENPDERGHGFVATEMEAVLAALFNGTTISLEDGDSLGAMYAQQLPLALAAGTPGVVEAIRAATIRALIPRFRVGLYDPPELVPWNAIPASVIESPAHHELARRAARESYVLLKNDAHLLPLSPPSQGGPKRIALVGPGSNCSACGVNRYSGHPNKTVGIWEGLAGACASRGIALDFGGEALSAQATAALLGAEVGVVVVEGEGSGESQDRFSIGLPAPTLAWLDTLRGLPNLPPLIFLVTGGGAVDTSPALTLPGAALALYVGGMDYGLAVADVLFTAAADGSGGGTNPSGCLAATIYKSSWINASDFLSMSIRAPPGRGHRYLTAEARAQHVQFPWGYGLSYTSWESSVVSMVPPQGQGISKEALDGGAAVTLTVSVANTGGLYSGSRVVYALASRVNAVTSEEWPVEWLPRAGFAKVHGVAPGGMVLVNLTLTARDFSRFDESLGGFAVRPGGFTLALRDGPSSIPITVTA